MGSIDKACISGFLCRLCSEMHRVVIHVYGDQGLKLNLVDKINGYLPITISPNDHLPKTICEPCLQRVEQHYDLLLKLRNYGKNRFEINLKKISKPNTDSNDPDRTSIGVNTEEYDPRPQLRSWLLNSTTYYSDSSITSSDEFEDYDMAEEEDTNTNSNNENNGNEGNNVISVDRNIQNSIAINGDSDIDEDAIGINVIVPSQPRIQENPQSENDQGISPEIDEEMRCIENDATIEVPA
ncbi:uncharacterized protein LOC129611805 [Condylostylus longicornis]|uniref:uncharacterized protein LOC129611805 n=1 Tax=Condylostylus longicornis TaxID=2530218 RepID=UPI00244E00A0|nr:uncharacterized protein LOC129611805 [Condylostylus longicornis]